MIGQNRSEKSYHVFVFTFCLLVEYFSESTGCAGLGKYKHVVRSFLPKVALPFFRGQTSQ